MMLFKKDGKDLIVHMNKSGYVFVLDKKTGDIENIWPISDLKNFVKDIDRKTGKLVERVELTMNKETLICPSTFGARSWNSGAYNPKTGLWYNDVLDFCGYLKPVEQKSTPSTTAPATPARTISAGWSWRRTGASPESSAPTIRSPASVSGRSIWTCRASLAF